MNPFVFQNPIMLLLLPLVVPLWWLLRRARYKRNLVLARLGDELSAGSAWKDRCRLAAVALLLLALARPGINPQRRSVSKSGRDVVFVLDVSQSMLARDAFPSRLEAAKDGVRDALGSFQSERAALVIYAGSANILCPLTYDYDFVGYMLDQATPRAVDFGGTTLLSATQKCVDTVLSDHRKGMQDLVVLTDGEEHGSQNQQVVELLTQKEAGLLMVGIGDATAGARIPIESQDGATTYLKNDGQVVTTQLNDSGLRALTRMFDDADYVAVGTAAFDLGGIYQTYAAGKPVAPTAGADTFVVYREIGILFIGVALVLLVLAQHQPRWLGPKRKRSVQAASVASIASVAVFGLLFCGWALAEDPDGAATFADATRRQEQGRFADALEVYESFELSDAGAELSSLQLATLRVNQGVCYLGLAKQQTAGPRAELSIVQKAQTCFLDACRLHPGFDQANRRLDPTASRMAEIKRRIETEDQREMALQQQLQEMLQALQELSSDQIQLREMIPHQPPPQRAGEVKSLLPQQAPKIAAAEAEQLVKQQRDLHRRGREILTTMQELDQQMVSVDAADRSPEAGLLQVPLQLMTQAVDAQSAAEQRLRQWSSWASGRDQQQLAITRLQEILDLLTSDNDDSSEEGDWDEDQDYDEWMEAMDSENAQLSSMQGQGDYATGSAMQPLPTPNYSVEDILQQEQGNLQFRQQQRAKGNQSKVEKDW